MIGKPASSVSYRTLHSRTVCEIRFEVSITISIGKFQFQPRRFVHEPAPDTAYKSCVPECIVGVIGVCAFSIKIPGLNVQCQILKIRLRFTANEPEIPEAVSFVQAASIAIGSTATPSHPNAPIRPMPGSRKLR